MSTLASAGLAIPSFPRRRRPTAASEVRMLGMGFRHDFRGVEVVLVPGYQMYSLNRMPLTVGHILQSTSRWLLLL